MITNEDIAKQQLEEIKFHCRLLKCNFVTMGMRMFWTELKYPLLATGLIVIMLLLLGNMFL